MKSITNLLHIACFASVLFSCSNQQEPAQTTTAATAKSAFALKKQSVSKTMKIPAELLPYERAEINARVEGYVQRVSADIGDRVKAGSVLAVLEAPEVLARYAEASAKWQEASAKLVGSADRYRRLSNAARQQGVVAEGELVNVKNQMLADSAAVASAKSTADAYKQLQNYLVVRAPFDGVVTSRSVDQGDLIRGSAGALFTVEKTDKLRLRVHVPESFVNGVPGEELLTFTADAVVSKNFGAKLSRKSGRINPQTRTELWEYEFDNTAGELKPGMYTTVELKLARPGDTFVVPATAVVTSLERKFVVRVKENKAEWVDVRQGISFNNQVEIFGALEERDILLTRGTEEIKEGAQVQTNIQ